MSTPKDKQPQSDTDYDVGYRKPPKDHQFPKGQSGNPGGRRPKEKKMEVVDIAEVLERPVTVRIGKTTAKIHPFEVTLRQDVKKALQDKSVQAVVRLIKAFDKAGLFKVPESGQQGGVIFAPKGMTVEEFVNDEMEKEKRRR
jgi:hypothetical protein